MTQIPLAHPKFGFFPITLYTNFGVWLVEIREAFIASESPRSDEHAVIKKVKWLWGWRQWRPSSHSTDKDYFRTSRHQVMFTVTELDRWFSSHLAEELDGANKDMRELEKKIEKLVEEKDGIDEDVQALSRLVFPATVFVDAVAVTQSPPEGARKEIKTKQELDAAWKRFSEEI